MDKITNAPVLEDLIEAKLKRALIILQAVEEDLGDLDKEYQYLGIRSFSVIDGANAFLGEVQNFNSICKNMLTHNIRSIQKLKDNRVIP